VEKYVDSDVGTTTLAEYEYLALSGVVEVGHPEPDLQYTLIVSRGARTPTRRTHARRGGSLPKSG